MPHGYPLKPEKFKNLNTVVSLVFAYYHALFLEGLDPATFRMFSFFSSCTLVDDQNEIGQFIEAQIEPFLDILPPNFWNDSIDVVFEFFKTEISYVDRSAKYFMNAQVHVFEKHSGTWLYSNPADFDESKRQLFFVGAYINSHIKELEVVLDISGFFNVFGTFCFFCQKSFRGKGSQHKCTKRDSCFVCRRPFQSKETYKTIKNFFCDSSLFPHVAKECGKCNLRILTDNCEKHHHSRVCRFGWLCPKCQRYTFKSKFLPQ